MAILNGVNIMLDWALFYLGLAAILGYPLYFLFRAIGKSIKENIAITWGDLQDLGSQTVILLGVSLILGILWTIPEIIHMFWKLQINQPILVRFVVIGFFSFLVWRHFGREFGERRWFVSALFHFDVIGLGYLSGRWVGVLFFSLPVLTLYYVKLYNLALVILPASDPENRAEKVKRFNVLSSYTWGIQSPVMVAGKHAWKPAETRIPGDFTWDFSDFPIPIIEKLKLRPGLIWTPAHQVVAITAGTVLRRIDGPGLVFTNALERPDQVFDLRLQIRVTEIDVISKDGIAFTAVVLAVFRLDPYPWDENRYRALRALNPSLRGADSLTFSKGSFAYSAKRIQAALGVTSTKATDNAVVYWDQWAVNVVEDQARKSISQRKLNEMWRLDGSGRRSNALDMLAAEIKDVAGNVLGTAGILLLAGRVVNFKFQDGDEQADEIMQQQLATWGSEWERDRAHILSEASAKAELAQQEARAYAATTLLNSIAEGMSGAKTKDESLPRYIIAMHFLSSLQGFLHKHPQAGQDENLLAYFKEWQDEFYPDNDESEA